MKEREREVKRERGRERERETVREMIVNLISGTPQGIAVRPKLDSMTTVNAS
jgi:hypothetical protein